MNKFQVIAVNRSGEYQGHAVYKFGGGRSTGIAYTWYAADVLRRWLVERDARYPSLSRFSGGAEWPIFDPEIVAGSRSVYCQRPCCRKGPKRARRPHGK